MATREQIAGALFQLLTSSATGLRTYSRRLRPLQQVTSAQMPALFLAQLNETVEHTQDRMLKLPPRRTLHFDCWLYTGSPQESSVIPVSELNTIVDAIEAALAPDPTTGGQTLGGLVAECRITGSIDYFQNELGDGKNVALIPISVLRP